MVDVFVGIDVGTERAGIARVSCAGELLGSSQVTFTGTLEERMNAFVFWVEEFLEGIEGNILVSIEEPFYGYGNARTLTKLAELVGVCMGLASRRNIPYQLLSPTEIKSRFTGNGRAKKADVQAAVRMLFQDGIERFEDECDAIAIAEAGRGMWLERNNFKDSAIAF